MVMKISKYNLSESDERMARTLFVFEKDGKIKCLSPRECFFFDLEQHGWKQSACLDPARWIEFLANSGNNQKEIVDDLLNNKRA